MGNDFKFLHEYPLFSGLNDEQMQAVMEVCREECFVPDAILFEEGQPAHEIFVLVEGEVEETFTVDEAKLSLLRPVDVGEIIGCPALVPPYTQKCTARSLSEIEVLAIDAVGLRELFAQDCQIASAIQQHVIEALLERIGKMRVASAKFGQY
ncbi:MAG: cyclic nucleotide-binding domain-containing protein [Ardenticatenaceae bacterium]|nr:cyclic nucleotide-binding domain-containing protein [Anaerolineales bacterium]MCB8920310.1 cyclic nucleotide-binding domain-containing protein [Ardenticatenaceae bacterium]